MAAARGSGRSSGLNSDHGSAVYYCSTAVNNSIAAAADIAVGKDNNTAADNYTAAAASGNCTAGAAADSYMAADCSSELGTGLSDTGSEQGRIAGFAQAPVHRQWQPK